MAEAGGIPVVAAVMEAHSDRADVQHFALWLLVSRRTRTTPVLRGSGSGPPGRTSVLPRHRGHVTLKDPESQQMTVEAGLLPIAIKMMDTFRETLEVHQHGCILLRNLVSDLRDDVKESTIPAIVEHQGLEVVLQAMKLHTTEAEVQEPACEVLSRVLQGAGALEEKCMEVMQDEGGSHVMLAAMFCFAKYPSIQAALCSALGAIAAHNSTNQELLVTMGTIEGCVVSMRSHDSHQDVQREGMTLLEQLTSGVPRNCAMLVQFGGVDVVVRALEVFEADAGIFTAAMRILRVLAQVDKHRRAIGHAGAIKLITKGMASFTKDEGPLLDALSALESICGLPKCQLEAVQVGGATMTVAAMLEHPHNEQLQRAGVHTLAQLTTENSSNQVKVCNAGGADAVAGAMAVHKANAEIVLHCMHTLKNLASNVDCQLEVVMCGGIETTLEVVQVAQQRADIVVLGCHIINDLCESRVYVRRRIAKAEGGSVLSRLLKENTHNDEVLSVGTSALTRVLAAA
ncbi:hypothetical protein CYMTET_36171 [Cymbomonas tetramitiformis]|uniref:LRRK2 ARM repeat domain-containing protein n=1 Tax=Cymbomonas tetramitiformis TaxID=36881 RepID=A0AAE0F7L3_9CHLO|nr:hypothetical protein CYMTET_36171 [Cymbomonas tetramitiformis]